MAGNCCGSNGVETVFTRDRVKPVQKRAPAHARARVHKYLTAFSRILFLRGNDEERTCVEDLDFSDQALIPERGRYAGALSDVSMQT